MENVLILHRSIRSILPRIALAVIVTAVFYFYFEQTRHAGLRIPIGDGESLRLPIWPLLLAVLLVRPLMILYDCRHEITLHHVRSEWGRCSLKKEDIEVPYEHLKGVKVHQKLWERVVDVGTVIAWTGIPGSPDLEMHGLKNPHSIAKILTSKIDQKQLES